MNKSLFEPFDLNDSEWNLFQCILSAGSLSPTDLAKATKLKRTTAYSVARSLVEKGLLLEDDSKRSLVFRLAESSQLFDVIEREKSELSKREDSYRKVAAELSKINAKENYPVPTVQFVQEEKMNNFLKKRSLVWDKSAIKLGECTWWGFQDHTFVENFGNWIEWHWANWDDSMKVQLLSNRATSEVEFARKNKERSRREIRFWGEALAFYSTTWIIGDYVIMINTRQKPFYLVEIHDKLMAHDQREVFRNLWEIV